MASALYGFFIVSLIGFSMMLLLFFILFIMAEFVKIIEGVLKSNFNKPKLKVNL